MMGAGNMRFVTLCKNTRKVYHEKQGGSSRDFGAIFLKSSALFLIAHREFFIHNKGKKSLAGKKLLIKGEDKAYGIL